MLSYPAVRDIAVVQLYCMIKTSPESLTGTTGMTSYSYFLLKKLDFLLVATFSLSLHSWW